MVYALPVVTVWKWDLERLLRRELSHREVVELLPKLKCEVEEFSGDLITYEAPHDRPDLFSAEGLARALRSLITGEPQYFNLVDRGLKAFNYGVPLRPIAAFGVVEDLELDDEAVSQIMNLQEKLHATYCRNRAKASIGVYDLDKVALPVKYVLADPDSTYFTPLGEKRGMSLREIVSETEKGRVYGHIISSWEKYPLIIDSSGVILSMPPIINSDETKVTGETKRVLIDSTGVDLKTVLDMVTIMATSIAERSISRKIVFVDTYTSNGGVVRAPRASQGVLSINVEDASSLLGFKVDSNLAANSLSKMGHRVLSISESNVVVEVPPHRIDVISWVDLAEDIAMAAGYAEIGKIAFELPPAHHPGRVHPLEHLSRRIRHVFIGMGFIEVVNYMMSNPRAQNEVFGSKEPLVEVLNPKMDKYTCLRRWLTPGLLEVIQVNQERAKEIAIFEIGDVIVVDSSNEIGARSERRIGFAISSSEATLTDGLAVLKSLGDTMGWIVEFKENAITGFIPERTARVFINGVEAGFIGEIDPRTLVNLGVLKPVVVCELCLNKLL